MSEIGSLTIRICQTALATVALEAAASSDGNETGGILLGRADIGGMVIRHAGGPGPRAARAPAYFNRDLEYAKQVAAAAWQRDGSEWVGEWHTHPRGPLVPSARDLSSYAAHLSDVELGFREFICLIAGAPSGALTPLTCWIVTPGGLAQATMVVADDTSDARC